MTERGFQRAVTELLTLAGWRWHAIKPARTPDGKYLVRQDGDPGWPDLVMVRGERLLFRELKTDAGRLTADQQLWLDALRAAGQDAGVWRPRDWDGIEREITG